MKKYELFSVGRSVGLFLLALGIVFSLAAAPVMAEEHNGDVDGVSACPDWAIRHWDKIIFMIVNKEVAEYFGLPYRSELDIKVLDDPESVADIKRKVWDFLTGDPDSTPPADFRKFIRIIDVDYAISGCWGWGGWTAPPA